MICICPTRRLSGPGSPLVITGIRSDCPQHGVRRCARWRCPICGQWVDKNAGWRLYLGGSALNLEDICLRCYHLISQDEGLTQTLWGDH